MIVKSLNLPYMTLCGKLHISHKSIKGYNMKTKVSAIAIATIKQISELTDLITYDEDVETAVQLMIEREELTALHRPVEKSDLELLLLIPDNTVFIENISNKIVKELMHYRTIMDKMVNYEKQFNTLVVEQTTKIVPIGYDIVLEDKIKTGAKQDITPTASLEQYVDSVIESEHLKPLFTDRMSGFSDYISSPKGWTEIHTVLEHLNTLETMEHDGDARFSLDELTKVIEHAHFVINTQYDSYRNREANAKGKIRAGKTITLENEKYVPVFINAYDKLGSFVLENEEAITPSMTTAYVMSHEDEIKSKIDDIKRKEAYLHAQELIDKKTMLIRKIGLENNISNDKIIQVQQDFIRNNTAVEEILLSLFEVGNLREFLAASQQYSTFKTRDKLIETAYLVVKWLLAQITKG